MSAHLGRGILPLIGGGISAMRGGWTMREPLVNWCGADIRHGMDGELTFFRLMLLNQNQGRT